MVPVPVLRLFAAPPSDECLDGAAITSAGRLRVLDPLGTERNIATFRLNSRSRILKRVEEYRARTAECRKLAASNLSPDLRLHYEAVADIWEKLTNERLTFFMGDIRQNADRQTIGKTGK